MADRSVPNPVRRGVTMIELLVVVGIIAILAVLSVGALRPMSESRRIREAARAVNVYFGNARNRAAETGRPVGVMFERLPRHPHASVVLRQVEVPPPFSGLSLDARVKPAGSPFLVFPLTFLRVHVPHGEFPNRLIRRGDLIQLNHQGPWYTIVDFPGDNTPPGEPNPPADAGADFPVDMSVDPEKQYIDFSVGVDSEPDGFTDGYVLTLQLTTFGVNVPYTAASAPVPFEILRQPEPSSVAPLELSRGAVVDLAASGFDSLLPDWDTAEIAHTFEPRDPADLRPVIVMFSPTGAVDRVYYTKREYRPDGSGNSVYSQCAYLGRPVIEPIHFLIGKWERLPTGLRNLNAASPNPPSMPPALAEDGLFNRQDVSNLWVTLSAQTGLVTVAELDGDTLDPNTGMEIPSGATLSEQLYNARRFAREAQISKGGR